MSNESSGGLSGDAQSVNFDNFDIGGADGGVNDIDLVLDIPVNVTVELGRAKMQIRNLLALSYGSVVELDVLAGEPLDVMVNGCLIAQGEVVIVNDRYGIRLTDIVTPTERLRKLNR
ncbi:MAG: flagellar motor switch protein FliN [Chitinophagaceae bacterium]|jgi:flagellar motor switch protein FliN/FliY|nr:flagellar motor switch protein FliN [Betaproteobacteria bacterium]NCW84585.1 flagellar motor switch protein FliN [Oxalobacteraceae bacterium]NDB53450.1 flagellar motor switch protein FliN [Chitinophagaceae bacterium]NBT72243.1 flagellar motor switch protein FliN [Betaproteobacteria bacterium]NBY53831.1 flagellar motor switch protein FliN [Betaproteobacteria bacterium]